MTCPGSAIKSAEKVFKIPTFVGSFASFANVDVLALYNAARTTGNRAMNEDVKGLSQYLKDAWDVLTLPLFHINNAKISISSVLISIATIAITVFLAGVVGRTINQGLSRRGVDSGVRDSIEKFSKYLLIAFGTLFSLENLGISISSLAAVGAVLMVGIGFGLQNITQNFISGIIILIERPIKVGDLIHVGSSSGRVVDIRVRSTIIQTLDDVTIIVPNSKLLSEEVINDSFSGQRIRKHVSVGVAYGSEVEKVKRLLCESVIGHPKVLAEPAPNALFMDFGDSSLNFDLRFWCSDLQEMDLTTSDIRTKIDRLFRENKIEIPFPQRDLHIRSREPDAGRI
jgi:small-conductance mechanosensitive channel